MKLLFLNNEFPPLGGGTATVTEEILRQVEFIDSVNVDLVTGGPGSTLAIDSDSFPSATVFRLPLSQTCYHHATVFDLLRYTIKATWFINRHLRMRTFDGCLAWSTVPAGALAWTLKMQYGLPYSVRVSGPDIPGFEDRYRLLYPIITPLLKRVWHGAQRVICKCQEEIDAVERVYKGRNLTLIPNGVDTARFTPRGVEQSSSTIVLLCVGRLIPRKGQELLFRVCQALKLEGIDVLLRLVGDGDHRARYERMVAELGLSNLVVFDGCVHRRAMPELYRACDIFVLPSFNEGMSVAALEALASGLPLVVTDCGGMREIVEHGKNGFLIPVGDEAALLHALRTLIAVPDMRRRFSEYSRSRAISFSWAEVARSLLGGARIV